MNYDFYLLFSFNIRYFSFSLELFFASVFVCRELSYFIFLLLQLNEFYQNKNEHSTRFVNTELEFHSFSFMPFIISVLIIIFNAKFVAPHRFFYTTNG